MVVVVYTSSASASTEMKKKQKAIMDFLMLHKIEFEEIDLCIHTDAKDVMRSKIPEDIKKENEANKKVVLPPQVFNDDEYCGDYDMFFNAREMELLHTFFKITPPAKTNTKQISIDWNEAEKRTNQNSENITNGVADLLIEKDSDNEKDALEESKTDHSKKENESLRAVKEEDSETALKTDGQENAGESENLSQDNNLGMKEELQTKEEVGFPETQNGNCLQDDMKDREADQKANESLRSNEEDKADSETQGTIKQTPSSEQSEVCGETAECQPESEEEEMMTSESEAEESSDKDESN